MKEDSNIILGAGVTGLILVELLREERYKIYSDNIGGQMASCFPLGPRILHYTEKVEVFLNNIGIYSRPKVFKIGLRIDGVLVKDITLEDRQKYFEKTRSNSDKFSETSMSGGVHYILGWDINEIKLVKILHQRNANRIYNREITSIDSKKKLLNGNIEYDKLISTIDLMDMLKILDGGYNYDLSDDKKEVFFYLVECKYWLKDEFDNNEKLSYLYDITHPFINRITKINYKQRVIETNIKCTNFSKYVIIKEEIKNTQIRKELKINYCKGIVLEGRYAQYNHNVKANDIIENYM